MAQTSKASTSANESKKLVVIQDLPLYFDQPTAVEKRYKFVEDDPLPLEKECRRVRLWCMQKCGDFAKRFESVDKALNSACNIVSETRRYLTADESFVLPKAAAITVGGMAGFVVSLRRHGVVRKVLYPAIGLSVMAAFCYPVETIDFARIGFAHAQRTWEDFSKSPEPKTKK